MSMNNRVLRGNKRIPPSRYSPYTSGPVRDEKEKQKEEAVRLGVELSLYVAEAVFLLSDEIYSTAWFGFWLCEKIGKEDNEGIVVGRLCRVIRNVFATYIKPKNGEFHPGAKSIQWELISTCTREFEVGVRVLYHIVSTLKKCESSLVKSSDSEFYKQEMKNLEEKLRHARDVSEANGFLFVREEIKSNSIQLWKSLFEPTPQEPFKWNKLEPSSVSSSDISIMAKQMETMSMTQGRQLL